MPSITAAFEQISLRQDEHLVLLIAALCTDAQLDSLLDAAQIKADTVATSAVAAHLNIEHGRFSFVDPRLSVWILDHADDAEIARAHGRLQQVQWARGEEVSANWHRARGASERTPEVVRPLVAAARSLTSTGHLDRAFTLAAEAAEHASTGDEEEARLVAGTALLGTGCVEDAADWLGSIFLKGTNALRAHALSSLLLAETWTHGVVPVLDPSEHRPRAGDDTVLWCDWARTSGLMAYLCAERGDRSAMRSWLGELREADPRAKADGTFRDPAVALCGILSGDDEAPAFIGAGPLSGGVIGALRAALDDDIDRGLQLLARAQTPLVSERDPMIAGLEQTPLIDAYLAVTEVLLHFWKGDFVTARERLLTAAIDLPVGIPFDGLGTTLAHRLDIAVLGAPSALALALAETAPGGIKIDRLVDNGIEAYLTGNIEQAVTNLTLWHDRGAPEQPLAIAGLDEVGPIDKSSHIEPSELSDASTLRRRIRLLPEGSWRREYTDIAAAARRLRSPFARARVEAMLGSVSVIRGIGSAARRHLQSAQVLFDDAGAHAWRDAITARLARLGEHDAPAASRTAWEPVLTERELEVAMCVVEGQPNRQIADVLDLSVRTIEAHTGHIFNKLGVRSRAELMVLAHRTNRHL
ncbi:LuxR C-terminal-related transcriptional regulator [Microbacterium sp. CH12i]|uniref:LuxR C-terminal-related transcriptional regulator n=1 Tax=Microbacterium sp. CH12i TaxID=1479651 RepID=UPI0013643D94|nr:LuxR C-terminal-related transcriptional regulator [Microbacterium sp. CH12i]